jgi:hypothetical protein
LITEGMRSYDSFSINEKSNIVETVTFGQLLIE